MSQNAKTTFQFLIKDPEIHSKTWILELPSNATVAELVGRFLLRRSGGYLSQPCLLRMSYLNTDLTSNLSLPLMNVTGLPTRGSIIHTMWQVSAGHVSSRCNACNNISAVVAFTPPPVANGKKQHEPDIVWGGSEHSNIKKAEQQLQGKKDPKKGRGKPVGQKNRVGDMNGTATSIESTEAEAGTATIPVPQPCASESRRISINAAGIGHDSTSSSISEVMRSLERMVAACVRVHEGVVEKLDRLAELKRNGELTNSEYQRAKFKLLE